MYNNRPFHLRPPEGRGANLARRSVSEAEGRSGKRRDPRLPRRRSRSRRHRSRFLRCLEFIFLKIKTLHRSLRSLKIHKLNGCQLTLRRVSGRVAPRARDYGGSGEEAGEANAYDVHRGGSKNTEKSYWNSSLSWRSCEVLCEPPW